MKVNSRNGSLTVILRNWTAETFPTISSNSSWMSVANSDWPLTSYVGHPVNPGRPTEHARSWLQRCCNRTNTSPGTTWRVGLWHRSDRNDDQEDALAVNGQFRIYRLEEGHFSAAIRLDHHDTSWLAKNDLTRQPESQNLHQWHQESFVVHKQLI